MRALCPTGVPPGYLLQLHIFVLYDSRPVPHLKKDLAIGTLLLADIFLRRENAFRNANNGRFLSDRGRFTGKNRGSGLISGPKKGRSDQGMPPPVCSARPREVRSRSRKYARFGPGFPVSDPTRSRETP
jgi:hypothetical protein